QVNMTGSGTLLDPYVIWDINDLQAMASGIYAPNAYYELGCDIDASVTSTWNWNAGRGVFEGFIPRAFAGNFDGRNYPTSNLYENWTAGEGGLLVGLFSSLITAGAVKNVRIVNANITGYAVGDNAPVMFTCLPYK
ncbi:unnamed protein product, partial [marine sediment metagenome]